MATDIMCRLCLCESVDINSMIAICDNQSLQDTIFTITSLKVADESTKEVFLCEECDIQLRQCANFRDRCIINDGIYRRKVEYESLVSLSDKGEQECIVYSLEQIDGELAEEEYKDDISIVEDLEASDEHCQADEQPTQPSSKRPRTTIKKPSVRRKPRTTGTTITVAKRSRSNVGEVSKTMPCSQCGKMIVRGNMNKHLRTHNPDRPRKFCSHCGQSFKDSQLLKVHINSHHTLETKYTCNVCGKVYFRPNSLREHVLAQHTEEKRYECNVCGLKFANFSKKSHHFKAAHTTARPFACQYCEKSFKFKCDLTLHTRIHTGEKPFKCDICGKAFNKSYNVVIHKKSHQNDRIEILSAT